MRQPHGIALLAIVLLGLGLTCGHAGATETGGPLQCLGADGRLQRVRDNLEVASAYLKSSKDNFGPARQRAIDSARDALAEFARLRGNPRLAPTPAAEGAPYLGSHGHPRMHRALTALNELKNDLNGDACRQDARLDAMRQDVAQAISAIYAAFSINPPYSGH